MNAIHSSVIARRHFLAIVGSLPACSILGIGASTARAETRKGRIKQAVCLGVFKGTKLELSLIHI